MRKEELYKWTRNRLQYLHSFTLSQLQPKHATHCLGSSLQLSLGLSLSVLSADHFPQLLLSARVSLPSPHALAHGAAVLQGFEGFGGGDAHVSLGADGEDGLCDGRVDVPGRGAEGGGKARGLGLGLGFGIGGGMGWGGEGGGAKSRATNKPQPKNLEKTHFRTILDVAGLSVCSQYLCILSASRRRDRERSRSLSCRAVWHSCCTTCCAGTAARMSIITPRALAPICL